MAKARVRSDWRGPVEKYIRKVVLRGREVYRVQIGGAGRGNRRSKICPTLQIAVETKRAWLAGEIDPAAAGPAEDSVDVDDALRHHEMLLRHKGKDVAADRTSQVATVLGRSYPELLAVPIAALTDGHFAALVDLRRSAGIKDNTIIRDLRSLRAAVKHVRPDFKVTAEIFPSENLTRVRVLTDEVRHAVFPRIAERAGAHFARMAELAMLGVMRLTEVRMLTRSMVHLPERLLLLPRTKGNPPTPRSVRLSGRAVALLREQLASHEHGYVFANPRTGEPYTRMHVSRVWRLAIRSFGIHGFTFHDLRHHGPTIAVNAGANAATIRAMGGWKTDRAAERYASVLAPTVDHYLALVAGESVAVG